MKGFFKPKYRIKRLLHDLAVLQVKRWYWPFWINASEKGTVSDVLTFFNLFIKQKALITWRVD